MPAKSILNSSPINNSLTKINLKVVSILTISPILIVSLVLLLIKYPDLFISGNSKILTPKNLYKNKLFSISEI